MTSGITRLNFELPLTIKDGEYITGHIDLIQIRNGSIHVMDFKRKKGKTNSTTNIVCARLINWNSAVPFQMV